MVLAFIAMLTASITAITCPTNSVRWSCEGAWIARLPERQQTVVLMILREHANDLAAEWVRTTSYATKADKCRMSAFGGFTQGVISEAATNSPALRAYLDYETGLMWKFARKEISSDEFKTGLSGRSFPSSVLQIVREDYTLVSRAYSGEIEQVKTVLAEAGWKAASLACNS